MCKSGIWMCCMFGHLLVLYCTFCSWKDCKRKYWHCPGPLRWKLALEARISYEWNHRMSVTVGNRNFPFWFTDLRGKDADVWLLVRKESIWINGSILFVLLSDFCKLWKPGSRMWQIGLSLKRSVVQVEEPMQVTGDAIEIPKALVVLELYRDVERIPRPRNLSRIGVSWSLRLQLSWGTAFEWFTTKIEPEPSQMQQKTSTS